MYSLLEARTIVEDSILPIAVEAFLLFLEMGQELQFYLEAILKKTAFYPPIYIAKESIKMNWPCKGPAPTIGCPKLSQTTLRKTSRTILI